MRVLFLITSNSLADGIARHVLTVCTYLQSLPKDQIEVAVCVVQPEGDLQKALYAAGVRAYTLDCPNGHAPCGFFRFRRVCVDFRPNLIHVHTMAFFERVYLSWFGRRVPLVSTIHGVSDAVMRGEHEHVGWGETALDRLFPVRFAETLFISGETRRLTHGSGAVCYNPIDRPTSITVQRPLGDAYPVIGLVGRLAAVKDLVSFLATCRLVQNRIPQTEFVIVGCGPEERLKTSEDARVLGAHLHWLGYRTDALQLIAGFDVFLMTSRWEGLPTTLLECFVAGTPVCAFRSPGGVEEIAQLAKEYEGGVAEFVDGRDCGKLAESVIRTLDPANHKAIEQRKANAKRMVADHFDVKVVGQQLVKIYCEVTTEHSEHTKGDFRAW